MTGASPARWPILGRACRELICFAGYVQGQGRSLQGCTQADVDAGTYQGWARMSPCRPFRGMPTMLSPEIASTPPSGTSSPVAPRFCGRRHHEHGPRGRQGRRPHDQKEDEMKVVVINHITLDGVMQGPGRADEDTRHGFTQGGWATARNDETMGPWMAQRMGQPDGALLLGRRTYDDVLHSWNSQSDSPFAGPLNATPKYVVSSNPSTSLPWPTSTLLFRRHTGRGRQAQVPTRRQPRHGQRCTGPRCCRTDSSTSSDS